MPPDVVDPSQISHLIHSIEQLDKSIKKLSVGITSGMSNGRSLGAVNIPQATKPASTSSAAAKSLSSISELQKNRSKQTRKWVERKRDPVTGRFVSSDKQIKDIDKAISDANKQNKESANRISQITEATVFNAEEAMLKVKGAFDKISKSVRYYSQRIGNMSIEPVKAVGRMAYEPSKEAYGYAKDFQNTIRNEIDVREKNVVASMVGTITPVLGYMTEKAFETQTYQNAKVNLVAKLDKFFERKKKNEDVMLDSELEDSSRNLMGTADKYAKNAPKREKQKLPFAATGGIVTQTGKAVVHKGEAIVPERKAYEMRQNKVNVSPVLMRGSSEGMRIRSYLRTPQDVQVASLASLLAIKEQLKYQKATGFRTGKRAVKLGLGTDVNVKGLKDFSQMSDSQRFKRSVFEGIVGTGSRSSAISEEQYGNPVWKTATYLKQIRDTLVPPTASQGPRKFKDYIDIYTRALGTVIARHPALTTIVNAGILLKKTMVGMYRMFTLSNVWTAKFGQKWQGELSRTGSPLGDLSNNMASLYLAFREYMERQFDQQNRIIKASGGKELGRRKWQGWSINDVFGPKLKKALVKAIVPALTVGLGAATTFGGGGGLAAGAAGGLGLVNMIKNKKAANAKKQKLGMGKNFLKSFSAPALMTLLPFLAPGLGGSIMGLGESAGEGVNSFARFMGGTKLATGPEGPGMAAGAKGIGNLLQKIVMAIGGTGAIAYPSTRLAHGILKGKTTKHFESRNKAAVAEEIQEESQAKAASLQSRTILVVGSAVNVIADKRQAQKLMAGFLGEKSLEEIEEEKKKALDTWVDGKKEEKKGLLGTFKDKLKYELSGRQYKPFKAVPGMLKRGMKRGWAGAKGLAKSEYEIAKPGMTQYLKDMGKSAKDMIGYDDIKKALPKRKSSSFQIPFTSKKITGDNSLGILGLLPEVIEELKEQTTIHKRSSGMQRLTEERERIKDRRDTKYQKETRWWQKWQKSWFKKTFFLSLLKLPLNLMKGLVGLIMAPIKAVIGPIASLAGGLLGGIGAKIGISAFGGKIAGLAMGMKSAGLITVIKTAIGGIAKRIPALSLLYGLYKVGKESITGSNYEKLFGEVAGGPRKAIGQLGSVLGSFGDAITGWIVKPLEWLTGVQLPRMSETIPTIFDSLFDIVPMLKNSIRDSVSGIIASLKEYFKTTFTVANWKNALGWGSDKDKKTAAEEKLSAQIDNVKHLAKTDNLISASVSTIAQQTGKSKNAIYKDIVQKANSSGKEYRDVASIMMQKTTQAINKAKAKRKMASFVGPMADPDFIKKIEQEKELAKANKLAREKAKARTKVAPALPTRMDGIKGGVKSDLLGKSVSKISDTVSSIASSYDAQKISKFVGEQKKKVDIKAQNIFISADGISKDLAQTTAEIMNESGFVNDAVNKKLDSANAQISPYIDSMKDQTGKLVDASKTTAKETGTIITDMSTKIVQSTNNTSQSSNNAGSQMPSGPVDDMIGSFMKYII